MPDMALLLLLLLLLLVWSINSDGFIFVKSISLSWIQDPLKKERKTVINDGKCLTISSSHRLRELTAEGIRSGDDDGNDGGQNRIVRLDRTRQDKTLSVRYIFHI